MLKGMLQTLDHATGKTCQELATRIGGLEQACKVTAEAMATQLSTQIKDFSVSLKGVRNIQEKHGKRLDDLDKQMRVGTAGY
jgi:hypothetical protein